ncbi:MAG: hypothetical protein KGQ80_07975 [Bacteroidetes bacterium]|nr:hypothetical protein [Bacteroidota bacterium]
MGYSLNRPIQYKYSLFTLNSDNVVRKHHGLFFMNTRFGPENRKVRMLELSRSSFNIRSINENEILAILLM